VIAHKELRIERLRPRAETGDRHDLLLVGEVHHDWRYACDIDEIALQYPKRDPGGAARIDRVAACLQDVEPSGRGEVMPRRDGVLRDGDGRPMG
jgi:hypothetical protein